MNPKLEISKYKVYIYIFKIYSFHLNLSSDIVKQKHRTFVYKMCVDPGAESRGHVTDWLNHHSNLPVASAWKSKCLHLLDDHCHNTKHHQHPLKLNNSADRKSSFYTCSWWVLGCLCMKWQQEVNQEFRKLANFQDWHGGGGVTSAWSEEQTFILWALTSCDSSPPRHNTPHWATSHHFTWTGRSEVSYMRDFFRRGNLSQQLLTVEGF